MLDERIYLRHYRRLSNKQEIFWAHRWMLEFFVFSWYPISAMSIVRKYQMRHTA